jgi:two-component system sensor histidine kinase UhpB
MQPSAEKWARIRAEAARIFPRQELLITALYVLLAAAWSVGSDMGVDKLTGDPDEALTLQSSLKGLNFLLTSSALLYLLLRRLYARRRAAELVVVDQAERFELVARASNDVLWDMDVDGETVWWSEGYTQMFGGVPDGHGPLVNAWSERIHPQDRERVQQEIDSALSEGRNVGSYQYRLRKSDGTYATVLGRVTVVRDVAGKPVRMAGGITDETLRMEAERELRSSRERLRALSTRLQTLREDERARIAREIHDELGQWLTALRMNLRWIEDRLAKGSWPSAVNPVVDRVVESTEMTDQVLGAVRRIATDLRPSVLDFLGLGNALRLEAARFEKQAGIPCHLLLPEEVLTLPLACRTEVFRIFQESLNNVARHAQAAKVRATLSANAGRVVLEVRDNGRGLGGIKPSDSQSLGMLGMQERASTLQGTLTFQDAESGGTVVTLDFPLPASMPSSASAPLIPRRSESS